MNPFMLIVSDKLKKAYRSEESFYELFDSKNNKEYVKRLRALQSQVHEAAIPKFNSFFNIISKFSNKLLYIANA